MTVELITGHAGSAHISAADDGWYNVGVVGSGKYVLDTGTQFACNVQSANLVTIGIGDALFEGRHVRVSATENVALDNGAQGVNRNDLICIKYEYNSSTSVESASLAVIKGTTSSGTPSDPTIPSGSILNGATAAYMPLWRIPISGITVGTPVKMYGNVVVTLNGLLSKTWTASQIPNLAAGKITSGTFDAARIPSLDASKIGSGTLAAARIPSLDASKISTGTLSADRIPNLNASKITDGTLPVARGGTGKTSGTAYMADTLYNSTATTSNITLSASAANYSMLEIYYRDNDTIYDSTKVFAPNGKTVTLSIITGSVNTQNNYKRRQVSISGKSVTTTGYCEQDGNGDGRAANNIYIYAVVGYK